MAYRKPHGYLSGVRPRRRRPVTDRPDHKRPRLDPALRPIFRKIGVPEPEQFTPDPFQLQALDFIEDYDVLVSAPTGSGKTWIASQATHAYLGQDLRVWYASPLKALSNSIYQEFSREFGSPYCGILTGDRKENPDAPIIVGTTEILRNQLYDAMHEGTRIRTDLVILDEAHYLSDRERGVVWEEVLIYLPPRVRLLLLSATISNPEEVCAWLREIRGVSNRVVLSKERPVPLEMLFLFPDGLVTQLAGKRGLNARIKRFFASGPASRRRRFERINFGRIIRCLRELDLLPAIFFLKSRSDCDQAILSCPSVHESTEVKERIRRAVRGFLRDYPHLKKHRQMRPLVDSLVASHHGGQLPYWKVLIEKMMNKGYLEAIFSTSTVAAGVNFPARTVALVQSDRYNGQEFIDLTATDLHQMIGRAGRRGKDHIGFGLVIPGIHQDPKLIHDLKDSPPEPILSQIHINFSMALNLLLSHTPLEVKDLLERSFAAFQDKVAGSSFKGRWNQMVRELKKTLHRGRCDTSDPYEVMENIQKRAELQKEIRGLTRAVRHRRLEVAFRGYLKPGRFFLHKNRNVYVVFETYNDHGRFVCTAYNIKRTAPGRKQRLKLRRVDLNQVRAVFDFRVDLPVDHPSERLRRIFEAVPQEDLKVLELDVTGLGSGVEELDTLKQRLASLPCEGCQYLKTCHRSKKGPLRNLLQDFRSFAVHVEGVGEKLWLNFKRHVRFLKVTGFVDDMDQLTPDGEWASKLRLDQPLLIAEVIRKGALEGVSPEILAGGLAPFVWDRVQEVELRIKGIKDITGLQSMFDRILKSIEGIRGLKSKQGFETPPISFWPAAALYLWAKGVPWKNLLEAVAIDEGDMASLIMRTADHLRQVANLRETHPELASTAEQGIALILREPVYIL